MRQIVLGMLCTLILIYTLVGEMTLMVISSHRNELQNCVGQIVRQELKGYYEKAAELRPAQEVVMADITSAICARVSSGTQIEVLYHTCDLSSGMIYLTVSSGFYLPSGRWKVVNYERTVMVEPK